VSVSLASLAARVGPYSFPAENWSSLSVGHTQSLVTLPLRSQMLIALGKVFIQVLSVGREEEYLICLLNRNKQTCILCLLK